MAWRNIQDYTVVPSVAPVPNEVRQPSEIAAILLKFGSFLIVTFLVIFRILEGCDNAGKCQTAIPLHFWGSTTVLMDILCVPLMAWAARRYVGRQYSILKLLAWLCYVPVSVWGYFVMLPNITLLWFVIYWLAAWMPYLFLLLFVEYHLCHETPSRPDLLNNYGDTSVV